MRFRTLAPTVAVLALGGAGPAAAVTGGFGVSTALHAGVNNPNLTAATKDDNVHSCQVGSRKKKSTTKTPALTDDVKRKAWVVACEQPPKSEPIGSGAMEHAEASALAAFG
ncbi:MAG: hypothetical protein WCH31_04210 [Actinomycetes bacterium]